MDNIILIMISTAVQATVTFIINKLLSKVSVILFYLIKKFKKNNIKNITREKKIPVVLTPTLNCYETLDEHVLHVLNAIKYRRKKYPEDFDKVFEKLFVFL